MILAILVYGMVMLLRLPYVVNGGESHGIKIAYTRRA